MINVNVSLSNLVNREMALYCPVCGRAVLLDTQASELKSVFSGACSCGQEIHLEVLGWHTGAMNMKFNCAIQRSDMP